MESFAAAIAAIVAIVAVVFALKRSPKTGSDGAARGPRVEPTTPETLAPRTPEETGSTVAKPQRKTKR